MRTPGTRDSLTTCLFFADDTEGSNVRCNMSVLAVQGGTLMNREEVTLLGFEIVAYAGDARSKLLEALKAAEAGDFAKADALVEEANGCIAEAHHAQTSLLTKEAAGEDLAYSVTMMHGQDHLMTTILLKDMMHHLIELYKRGVK